MARKVRITVWSEVCRFCYLAEPLLERNRQEHGEAVDTKDKQDVDPLKLFGEGIEEVGLKKLRRRRIAQSPDSLGRLKQSHFD